MSCLNLPLTQILLVLPLPYIAGGTVYLFYLSRGLASACLGVTAILWAVALRFGAFSRRTARTYQDALAETNQASVLGSVWAEQETKANPASLQVSGACHQVGGPGWKTTPNWPS